MTSKSRGRCEHRSGEPFPGRRSNVLSIQSLERPFVSRALRSGSTFAWPFVFPWATHATTASYSVGPSAFSRTRPH